MPISYLVAALISLFLLVLRLSRPTLRKLDEDYPPWSAEKQAKVNGIKKRGLR